MSFLNPNLDLMPGNYAVIFSSERSVNPSPEGYDAMDDATMRAVEPVSYTHLTLPTICSV